MHTPPQPRSIEEIKRAFREMGIPDEKWGTAVLGPEENEPEAEPQIFIRISSTTTPAASEAHADLA